MWPQSASGNPLHITLTSITENAGRIYFIVINESNKCRSSFSYKYKDVIKEIN